MKPRPPTLRTKRRYILATITPWYLEIEPKNMYSAAFEAVTSLFGDSAAAEIQMSVIACTGGVLIVRCQRGSETRLETALATVISVQGQQLALQPVSTSGTIRALRRQIPKKQEFSGTRDLIVSEQLYTGYKHSGQKLDLHAKGINKRKTLYFTCDEVEEF